MSALRKDALVSQAAAAKSVEAAHESLDYLSRHAQLNSLHLQGSVFVVSPRFKAVSAKQNGLSLGFDLDVTALSTNPRRVSVAVYSLGACLPRTLGAMKNGPRM
jgi:hypothetical protein